jgi:membrane protein YqaA with SNARE-associated domain
MDWASGLAGSLAIDSATWWVALGSALVVGFVLGITPAGAAEAVALAAAAIPSMRLRIGVVVAFTAGHLIAKAVWFWLGTFESRVKRPRLRAWIERARTLAMRHPKLGLGLTATSAVTSVPPFHVIAMAGGLVHSPPVPFFAVAFAGRLVRFGALAASPSLVRYLFSLS